MAVKKPTGALPKGGGQAASGTKLVQPTVSQSNKGTSIPAGAINPQKIYSSAAIAKDFKVPLTPNQQAYQTKITAERMQAQADAYFKANPTVKPTEPVKPVEPVEPVEPPVDPDIPDTGGTNISSYGEGAPTYTAPTQTPEEVATLAETQAAAAERKNAFDVLAQRYTEYGLGSLVEVVRKLVLEGASEATITFALQETEAYKERFKANQTRIGKGLAVLSPRDYLGVEDSYRQVLRAYGLKVFDTDEYVSQFIANDMSSTELNNRVQMASQRIMNADPGVSTTLRNYYGLNNTDLIAYALDPSGQTSEIEKRITAAEIGNAASRQGLSAPGVGYAEYLATTGITQEKAKEGYSAIADILPTANKLSDIYGNVMDGYNQQTGEEEVFQQLASAKRKREKLVSAEKAQFSGSGKLGITKTSLNSSAGQY